MSGPADALLQRLPPSPQSSLPRSKDSEEKKIPCYAPQLDAVAAHPMPYDPQGEPCCPLAAGEPVHVRIPERRLRLQSSAVTRVVHETVHAPRPRNSRLRLKTILLLSRELTAHQVRCRAWRVALRAGQMNCQPASAVAVPSGPNDQKLAVPLAASCVAAPS